MSEISSINPKTEKLIKTYKTTSIDELENILKKSRESQKKWASQTNEQRISAIQKLKTKLIESKEKIISSVIEETGVDKNEEEAVFQDILDGIDYYTQRYQNINTINFSLNQFPETDAKVEFVPHGVIGHIGVWNYPFWQTMITAIPALLAGNSIIFKPSEYTTGTALEISSIINKTLQPGLYQVVIGGKELGKALAKSGVDAIVFTGSSSAGKDIIKNAGVKPLILEMSGNDAGIVCDDLDITRTVRGIATGAFLHGGQVCIRIKRLYVHKKIADKFIKELVNFSKTLEIGKQITPLIRETARNKVHKQVNDLLKKGGELLLGGKIPEGKGYYYPATIIKCKEAGEEEIFGPVLSIIIVDSVNQAIELANASDFGLGASIWSGNSSEAKNIAKKLNVGNVWINDSNLPLTGGEYFQGTKNSSISNSQERIMMFLKKKTIVEYKNKTTRPWWF